MPVDCNETDNSRNRAAKQSETGHPPQQRNQTVLDLVGWVSNVQIGWVSNVQWFALK